MASLEDMAGGVKEAIRSGKASSSTVATLQTLFGTSTSTSSTSRPGTSSSASRAPATKTRTTRPAKTDEPAVKGTKRVAFVSILEDEAKTLSPKARYALATEIVNISLKVLQDATKSVANQREHRKPCDQTASPQSSRAASPSSQKALQPRSNNATPAKPSQTRRTDEKTSVMRKTAGTPPRPAPWSATAECARMAFSQLRSADREKLGVRAAPAYQLETGMLALTSRMIALGLDGLAAKELCAVKKSLRKQTRSLSAGQTHGEASTTHETLASLLKLDIDLSLHPDVEPLAMTYWSYVLHLLANSHKSIAVEEAIPYLELDCQGSVITSITNYAKTLKDRSKASKQLDALFHALMRLTPSVSTSADAKARQQVRYIPPVQAFKVHLIALAVRKELLQLTEQTVNTSAQIVDSFAKCLATLLRRLEPGVIGSDILKICQGAYDRLISLEDAHPVGCSATFSINRTMSILAERAGDLDQACLHAEHASRQCAGLERNHARVVAGLTRICATNILLKQKSQIDDETSGLLQELDLLLQQSLSGSVSDYETLLGELAHLVKRHYDSDTDPERERLSKIARSTASFASRYARLSPGKQSAPIEDIIFVALSVSKTNEDLLTWVTKDTAHALSQTGVLQAIAERSAQEPLHRAWSRSKLAMGLSRALKGVVLKAAATSIDKSIGALYDDETLTRAERGVVLEWQLQLAYDLAHKQKYNQTLGAVISELVRRVAQVYEPSLFPIRHARVASMILRHRAVKPDMLSPPLLDAFTNVIDDKQLGDDEALKAYSDDIRASNAVARMFVDGNFDRASLEPHVAMWQRLLSQCETTDALLNVIDNPTELAQQLISLGDYFGMLGDHASQLRLSRSYCQLQRLLGQSDTLCAGLVREARSYLLLGYAEKAAICLEQARDAIDKVEQPGIIILDYHIAMAQYQLCVDELEKCSVALATAAEVRAQLDIQSIRSHESKMYRLCHVRGWLVQSHYLHAAGQSREALQAAKRAVKAANSIWAGLEKSGGAPTKQDIEAVARPVDTMTRGISKLNLKPSMNDASETMVAPCTKGAAFWTTVPLMCQALMHLSDVFRHHGIFVEANYSSEQAIKLVDEVQSHELLSLVRYHRSHLLTSAGKVEEAELCLAHEQDETRLLSPLTKCQQLQAKAAMSVKIGDDEQASAFLRKAEAILKQIQSEPYIISLERYPGDRPAGPATSTTKKKPVKAQQKAIANKGGVASKRTVKSSAATNTTRNNKPTTASVPKENTAWGSCYMLQKLEAQVMLQDAIISTELGGDHAQSVSWRADFCKIFPETFASRQLSYKVTMQKAEVAIGADFTFNALAESTLAFPALQATQRRLSVAPPARQQVSKGRKVAKSPPEPEESLLGLLIAARQCLHGEPTTPRLLSTMETHKQYALLADTSMVLSATSIGKAPEILHPARETMNVEIPRIHAAQCLSVAAKMENEISHSSGLLTWPQLEDLSPVPQLTARQFQNDYVDILPLPWTVVSLSLNEQCDELYVARYRTGQSPLLLRLPFSRQKSQEDDDDDNFDFHVGKAELQEIIELSNYSCHNSVETSVKGAKTNWWSEREALDRRLQELLINMENIWLGGFRGVLSQHDRNDKELDQFRKSFDGVLDRHLPSRKVRGSKRLALDDQILELFIGLGSDMDGEVDLDEPLADLLYFVVDMLQFNGERNAYDEVDFDSMAVEVLDALRTYYDAVGEQSDAAHLILVLDRRLQAFPWESMPCIEKSSVSRVDSMLTLRERIVAMRASTAHEHGHYTVSKNSGAYILNPSGDLKSTEAILAPELSQLTGVDSAPWTSVVKREPSEEVFKAALQTSSQLLYFGHGAGSQYIRPRTIRKLEKCSNVVWLMGCSSGAVTEYDELEPFSVPMAYLQAGQATTSENKSSQCMAVLATLWDVTDKDIDRFSLAVGQEWGLWQASTDATPPPAKTPRKRTLAVAPSTPERAAKTPKTPKARKTPAAASARTPARSRSRVKFEVGKKQSLVEAVAKSRDACFLRYLNGAAPVVYGVPVYLGE